MKRLTLFTWLLLLLSFSQLQAQLPGFTKTDCDGNTVDLYADLAAGNVVILNFCAGWCGPCRDADPLLEEVYQQTCANEAGIKIYGMLYQDYSAQPTDCAFADAYAAEFGLNFPLIADCEDVAQAYFETYNVDQIPSFFIIVPDTENPAYSQVYIQIGYIETLAEDILGLLNSLGYEVGLTVEKTGDFCADAPYAVLTSNRSEGNVWSTGETAQSITVTESGTYWVENYNSCGALSRYYIEVGLTTPPEAGTASISANVVCPDEEFILAYDGGQAESVEWLFEIPGVLDGLYYLEAPADEGPISFFITDELGGYTLNFVVFARNFYGDEFCYELSNMVSVSLPFLTGAVSISDPEVCIGQTLTLEYVPDNPVESAVWQLWDIQQFLWIDLGPADSGPLDINLSTPGKNEIRVKAYDPALGCHAYSPVDSIWVRETTGAILAPPCVVRGQTATLELVGYDPAFPVVWSTGEVDTALIEVSPEVTTTYSVTFTDLAGYGCEITLSHELRVEEVEVGILSVSSHLVMVGEPLTLSYSGGNNYFGLWMIRVEGDPTWYWLGATVQDFNPADIGFSDAAVRSFEFCVFELSTDFSCYAPSNVEKVFIIDENDIDPKNPDKVLLCIDNGINSRQISVDREDVTDLLFNNPNAHLGPCDH